MMILSVESSLSLLIHFSSWARSIHHEINLELRLNEFNDRVNVVNDLFEDNFKWLGVEQVIAEVLISSILVANTVDIDVETINMFLSSVTFHLSYLPGVFSVNPTKISRNSHFL